jgi:hypothetical protein
MIGQDFDATGNPRHITHRIGDGRGNPLPGPATLCYVKRNVFAILLKNGAIHIRNLRGQTDHIYYPLHLKDELKRRRSSLLELVEQKDPVDDWQVAFLKKGNPSVAVLEQPIDDDSSVTAPFTYIEFKPTALCKVPNKNMLAVTDSRFCVHILDLTSRSIIHTFGKGGTGIGEFIAPTSISAISVNVAVPTNLIKAAAKVRDCRS